MTSTAQKVHTHLDADFVLAQALDRDVLNKRVTARQLIKEHGWDTTEEAVVSALRRYEPERSGNYSRQAKRHLAHGGINVKEGLALASVPRTPGHGNDLSSLRWRVDGETVHSLIYKPSSIRFLVRCGSVDAIRGTFGVDHFNVLHRPVAEFRISLHEAPSTAPISAFMVVSALAYAGVKILDVLGCRQDIILIIPGKETIRAFSTTEDFLTSLGTDEVKA